MKLPCPRLRTLEKGAFGQRAFSLFHFFQVVCLLLVGGILSSHPAQATDINISPGSSESVIQSAINTVSQSGGGNVNLPAGTFVISNGLAMWSNVSLSGVGPATILQAPSTPSGVAIIYNPAEGLSNISVSNLVIDGHIPRSADFYGIGTPAPFQASGIYFFCYNSPCVNVVFSNVEIKNTSHGALIGGCDLFTFTHCNFHDNGDGFSHNVYFRSCSSMEMDHCKVDYSTIGDGLHIAGGGGGFTINKCQFVGNSGLGLLVQDNPQGLTLTNTLVESSYNHGIELNCYSTNISQDRFDYNDGYGILVDDPSSGIMAYNYYVNNSYDLFFDYDLSVGPFNTSYAGNVYEAEAADGITGPADTGDWITTYSGFSGLGAVDFNTNHATNGTLTWPAVTAQSAASYPLVFGYSNGLSAATSLALSINGVSAGTISFPPTGSWSTWKSVTVNANLLGKGNAVTLSVVPGTSAPLIDNMTVTASTPAAPTAPTGVTATVVSSQQINLSWNAVPGCSYVIVRQYPQGNFQTIAANVTGTTYSDSHLLYGGSNYTYIVTAVNAGGSASSGAVTGTTLIGAPAWAIATGQTKQVALQVLATQGAATYNVKRSTTSGGPYTIIGNFPNTGSLGGNTVYSSYTDTNVTVGVKYYYVFTGVNGSSESSPSPEVSAVPQAVVAPNAKSSKVLTGINSAVAFTLSGTDPNTPAQPLTYTVTTSPVHGTLSGTAPSLTYTPVAGYYGTDSFQFKVNNGVYDSSAATVSISIDPSNLANGSFETPNIGAGVFANNPTGAGWTFTGTSGIQANGNSVINPPNAPDGTQTGWVGSYNGALGSISQSVAFPAAGKYTLSFQAAYYANGGPQPLQLSVDGVNVGGVLTPASASSYGLLTSAPFTISSAGAHTLALASTVNSGTSISMVDQVVITAISVPVTKPTANAQTVTTAQNTSLAIKLAGTDTNVPALPLTYAVTTAPAHGTLSGTAPNLTYTPTTGYIGSDSLAFKVNNGSLDSAIATVSISVIGQPIAISQTKSAALNTKLTLTLTGTDPNTPAKPLTYTVTTAPTHGTLAGSAPNLTYMPTTGYIGADSVAFKVNNGTLDSAIATVSISVNATNLANSSFETPSVGAKGFVFNPTGGTWTFTGDSGIQANGSLLKAANAPDGTQTAFVESYPGTTTGVMSQSVTFPAAGTYTISFQSASAPGSGAGVEPVQLSIDGVVIGTPLTPASSAFGSLTSAAFVISTAGAHTISFAGTSKTGFLVTLVDRVTVAKLTVTAPALANSSFETPALGKSTYRYTPGGATWSLLGTSGIQSNGSVIAGSVLAPNGTQTAFLEGKSGAALGSISQALKFTGIGNFIVTFQAARRLGQVQPVKVSVDGAQVGALLTPVASGFGVLTSAPFTISATGTHTITLSATTNTADLSTLVDLVTISAAP